MGNGCNSLKSVLVHERIEQNEKELELPEIKILVVGDNFVGKTSVIQRFVNDTFCTEYNPTKEVEITSLVKNINVPKYGIVKLQIWEVPGHEKVDVRRNYYADSNAVIVVIDSSTEMSASFTTGAWWKDDVEKNYCATKMENRVHVDDKGIESLVREKTLVKSSTRDLPILLIGNKFDLMSHNAVTKNKEPLFTESTCCEKTSSEKTNKLDETEKDKTQLAESECTTQKTGVVEENGSAGNDITKEISAGDGNSVNENKKTNKVDETEKDKTQLAESECTTQKTGVVGENGSAGNDITKEISAGDGNSVNENKVITKDKSIKDNKETNEISSLKDQSVGVVFGETIKQTHLKEKERSIYLENYVEEFELFASDQGFVSSILVSSSSTQGGAIDAFQSLIRRALVRCPQTAQMRTTLSLSGNTSGGPDKWELFNIQEVGVDEIDNMLRQGIPLIEEGEKLRDNFKNAINLFKKACTEYSKSNKQLNTEECIDWLKIRINIPIELIKEKNKKFKERDVNLNSNSKLIMVNVGNFFQLGVASESTGDIIGSSMLHEDVINVLKIFNHQIWKYCNEVINKSDIIQKSLLRISDQLAFHEENLWEKSSGYQQQQLTYMTSSVTRDKTKVRGLLCDVKDTKSDVIKLRARVRAAVLF